MQDILNFYQESSISFFQETLLLYKKHLKSGNLKTNEGAYFSFNIKDDKNISFVCPIDKINCYRDFYAHEKHVAKGFEKRGEPIPPAWYEIPAYYKGPTTGFIGNDEFIGLPTPANAIFFTALPVLINSELLLESKEIFLNKEDEIVSKTLIS